MNIIHLIIIIAASALIFFLGVYLGKKKAEARVEQVVNLLNDDCCDDHCDCNWDDDDEEDYEVTEIDHD